MLRRRGRLQVDPPDRRTQGTLSRANPHPPIAHARSGWCFDGAGACKSIPQIGDPKAHATACGSARSAVGHFPSRSMFGLLWVWGEAGPGAAAEAAAAPPVAAPAELLSGEWTVKQDWFQR